MPKDIDKETQKEAIKEAIQEWLDKQYAALGRWTLRGLLSMGFAVLVYFYLHQGGWSK